MDTNYWKNAYKKTWDQSSQRENALIEILESATGRRITSAGLGAGTTDYISGSAQENGYEKGDADLHVEGTNIYIEVTGPLSKRVMPAAPLWFRPDKIENAIRNQTHDVFLAHHCTSVNLWRVIHVDEAFKRRYEAGRFPVVQPVINGRRERYIEVDADDICIQSLEYLKSYIVGL